MTTQQIGLVLIVAGSCLFVFKRWIAQKGAEIYSRFGINVTAEQYAKQVQIVAIALFVLGMIGVFSVVARTAFADTLTGKVVKVADGDTITVLDNTNTQHRIRLILAAVAIGFRFRNLSL